MMTLDELTVKLKQDEFKISPSGGYACSKKVTTLTGEKARFNCSCKLDQIKNRFKPPF